MNRTADRDERFDERRSMKECRALVDEACDTLFDAPRGFGKSLNIEFDDRKIGPLVDVDWHLPSKQGKFNVSKPRWCTSSDQQRELSVIAGTCHLVITANNFMMEQPDPAMMNLCGHHTPADDPHWDELAAKNAEVVHQTCKSLGVESLVRSANLQWNGRLSRRLAVIDWDSKTKCGQVRLAKKLWPLLVEDEQEEAIVQATCSVINAARPNLAKELSPPKRERRNAPVLMACCGYPTVRSPLGIFGEGIPPVFPPNRMYLWYKSVNA